MMLIRFQVLLCIIAMLIAGPATAVTCKEFLANESDLDQALEQSTYAFVAQVSVDDSSEPPSLRYKLFEPALKGDLPASGQLTYGTTFCAQLLELLDEGIIVVFLGSIDEIVTRQNATLLALAEDGPSFRWVSDWLQRVSDSRGPE
jgi:hypothetical protein